MTVTGLLITAAEGPAHPNLWNPTILGVLVVLSAIGLFCGSTVATLTAPITSCSASNYGATRVMIPGTPANPAPEDDVNNPPRIAPRHLFDLGLGVDNLLHTDKAKLKVRFSILNVANTEALYNFLSTFSGTHFVTPRAYQVQFGVSF